MENLPRTGIEHPFVKESRKLLTSHKEFEPLSEYPASPGLLSEYIRNDSDRANAPPCTYPIVYDCTDLSPHYNSEDPFDQYIDEKDAIELPPPSDQDAGAI